MVKYTSQKQLSIEEFTTPFQQKLSPDNRWVKLSEIIPWDELVSVYCQSLSAKKGRPSVDPRRVIAAIIIKHKLVLSDEETVLQIQENAYLQYFLGYKSYEPEPVFVPTLFVEIRKRMGSELFKSMYKIIIDCYSETQKRKDKSRTKPKASSPQTVTDSDSDDDIPKPKGKLLIDATVAEQAIKFPTDLDLLNESRLISENLIDRLYKLTDLKIKPRTYRKVAHNEYLATAKKKRKARKVLRKAIRKQLNYLARNFKHIENLLDIIGTNSFPIPAKYQRKYWIILEIYRQQKEMYDNKMNKCSDRIVSISQPHVRPIIRGKSGKKTEFGAKIGVGMSNGLALPETISWDAYNESSDLKKHVENYKRWYGFYPRVLLADNIYGTRANRNYLKSLGIRFGGKALGRPKKQTEENREKIIQERQRKKKEYRERIPIEGKFGQAKNGYRLNYIRAKLQKTSESWIHSIFLVMNLMKLESIKNKSFFKMLFLAKKNVQRAFFIFCGFRYT